MKNKRNVYLNMLSLNKAKELILNYFDHKMSEEIVAVNLAFGRILSKPVKAKISSPHFNAAAMDGIAVQAENTFKACEANPQELILGEEAEYVNTGQLISRNFNAVIMIEYVQTLDKNKVKIENPAFPWQNIRKIGEDIIASELLYTRSHEITSYCIGSLISAGIYKVPVRKKPKVLIIPTGSELVDWTKTKPEDLKSGQILETNSYVLEKMIEKCGGVCTRHESVLDDFDIIEKTVLKAVKMDFDIILTIGGSSSGSKDYALMVANNLGKVLVHGVTIMPGKPIIVADINSKSFFGIPGYPVSAIIAFEQFVQPLIRKYLCMPDFDKQIIKTIPSRKITSKLGIQEFLRVKLGKVGNKIVATTLPRSAGIITSITEADGIISIPKTIEGISEEKLVRTQLLTSLSNINNTIVAVGSHDNSLNILADQLKKNDTKLRLSSSHVGSIGGLISIKKGLCHIAGSHLLDEKTGQYNISYIEKYLSSTCIKLVNLVMRDQGLFVLKGNPKNIRGFKDLEGSDIVFVNRQKGSGTRILLDYQLAKIGISAKKIKGYFREEFTHMDVAMAISTGSADVGLGIYAASKAFNLDFIPIITEQYDLIIAEEFFYSSKIEVLMEIICSKDFKTKVNLLGGYSTENTGKVII